MNHVDQLVLTFFIGKGLVIMKIFLYWNSQAECVPSTSSYACFHYFNYSSYALVYYSQSEWSLSLTADSTSSLSQKASSCQQPGTISANGVAHTDKNWFSSRCRCCWCELFLHIWQEDIIANDVKSNESVWCVIIKRCPGKYIEWIYRCLAHNFGLGHCIQAAIFEMVLSQYTFTCALSPSHTHRCSPWHYIQHSNTCSTIITTILPQLKNLSQLRWPHILHLFFFLQGRSLTI